ncbi:ligase-associated DNA damage response DEXH box helicase [bacterium]|nr:ligase-associated DNA damage response DEXH box helicase [bacterium]
MNRALTDWIRRQGWRQFRFQREAAQAIAAGGSGLIHAPTGTGKTLAVWLPLIDRWLLENGRKKWSNKSMVPFRVLWITPLRALSHDTLKALRKPVVELGLPWSVEARTGDTSAAQKARQFKRPPTALVTTPESLSLLLSFPETQEKFATLQAVVVDEWHELLSSKRGIQTELALARLRKWNPQLQTWGLSATLSNLDEALSALLGVETRSADRPRVIISGDLKKKTTIETIIPRDMEKFPWAGHLGLKLLPDVIKAIEQARTTLVFTNTRSQTELWFQSLLQARPGWADDLGIHHGSLDREEREAVEQRLRAGTIRAVVCTSSLDLGVDFSPVEQVIQIGGPKGIARLLQRAGRSGHQPGAVSRILCVPTQAMELIEYAAAREAMKRREIEPRAPLSRPLDVLVQHLVTCALGGGFTRDELLTEVRAAYSYRDLTEQEFDWALQFVVRGGKSLQAYPEYHRVVEINGRHSVESPLITRFHRMQIGTIAGDQSVSVKFLSGKTLGTVEESFVAKLKRGSRFSFAGRPLELVRFHDLNAYVRPAKKSSRLVAIWGGSRLSFSSELAHAVRRQLDHALDNRFANKEMRSVRGVLQTQADWSSIPRHDELLIETTDTREGRHWFLFPFAGRLGHEGLGSLLAHRMGQRMPATITIAVNDYGLELLPAQELDFNEDEWRALLSPDHLLEDMLACLNTSELARRQFREVARVAGLVFQGYPGARKTARQVQASSSLFYEVFAKYEPDHLLLEQARREVLERQLEVQRLRGVLEWAQTAKIKYHRVRRLTPFSFPLWAEMLRGIVSTESWADRVARMAADLESAAQNERSEHTGVVGSK